MPEMYSDKAKKPSHTQGTRRGEEELKRSGKEPGREKQYSTARSATSINPKSRDPIDKRMPHLPPP
ncbi:MAG: hypothetical protein JO041_10305 [Acidobacteria bacterium]|nr:hypothetical protein [Acidobacteriota bacterium]